MQLQSAVVLAAALLVLSPWGAIRQEPEPPSAPQLLDRVVAVVNDEAILLSDLERAVRLGLVEAAPEESTRRRYRTVLDRLIEQSLRLQEVERLGPPQVSPAEVDRQLERLRTELGAAGLGRALSESNLSESALRQLLLRQLQVLAYVDERLGPRVFIELGAIETYYTEQLRPQLEAENLAVPPLEAVQEQIRALLRERELNRELERWTTELRRRADVVDYLDRPPQPLPPLRDRRPPP